jgi:hypothetical protein
MLRSSNRLVHTPMPGRPGFSYRLGVPNSCYPYPGWFFPPLLRGSCGANNLYPSPIPYCSVEASLTLLFWQRSAALTQRFLLSNP